MKAATVLALGLKRARRHPAATLAIYLASLGPTLLVLVPLGLVFAGLDRSLFASRLLTGDSFAVLTDLRSSPGDALAPITGALPAWMVLTGLIQILVAAGVVETLLERTHRRERPFWAGVGGHSWAFARSALGFLVFVGMALALAGLVAHLGAAAAIEQGDGRLQLAGLAGAALIFGILFVPLDLAYDLSRIAAASHAERRTFLGLLRALGFVLRHPLLLAPFYLVLALLILAPRLGYVALRPLWPVDTWAEVALLALVQQAIFLWGAFFKSTLWGTEIALYQGFGEPRWCRAGARARAVPSTEAGSREAVDSDGRNEDLR